VTDAASIPLVFLTAYTALVHYAALDKHPYERGNLNIIIDSVYSLEDGKVAFEKLSEGKSNGKVVIKCQ